MGKRLRVNPHVHSSTGEVKRLKDLERRLMEMPADLDARIKEEFAKGFMQDLRTRFRGKIDRQKARSRYPDEDAGEESTDALLNSLDGWLVDGDGDNTQLHIEFGENLPYADNLNKDVGVYTEITSSDPDGFLVFPNRKMLIRKRFVPARFAVRKVNYPGTEVFSKPYKSAIANIEQLKSKAIASAIKKEYKGRKGILKGPNSVSVPGETYGRVVGGKRAGRKFHNVRGPGGRFASKGKVT